MYRNPDYHWQPPASGAYAFDLAKAGQMLTAAGYPLKNGVRVNKQGKPIVLRLWAATDSASQQTEARLITGWLEQLGLKIKLSVVDSGAMTSDMYNYHGGKWEPNFDLVVSGWVGYFDPGETLNCLMTSQIGNLNEPYWSDPAYDRLALAQENAVLPQQRQPIIWQMQQVMYEQTPWIVLNYPDNLQAINTAKWTGWSQQWNGTGPAWQSEGYIASYLDLRPKVASTTTSSGSGTTVIVVIVLVVVVAAGIAYAVVRQRRRRVEDET